MRFNSGRQEQTARESGGRRRALERVRGRIRRTRRNFTWDNYGVPRPAWVASVILAQFRVPALSPRQLHSARVELGVTLAQFWR